jgi:hypothetical protein
MRRWPAQRRERPLDHHIVGEVVARRLADEGLGPHRTLEHLARIHGVPLSLKMSHDSGKL